MSEEPLQRADPGRERIPSAIRALLAPPLLALTFLTIVPAPSLGARGATFSRAVAYFPLVGLLVGAAVAACDAGLSQVLPGAVVAALDLALLAILTGGLHLDGLADTADGLLASADRERRLAIMREGTIGAFALAAVALVLIVEYAALASLETGAREPALISASVLGRWCMAVALWRFPYARPVGAGALFRHTLGWRQLALASGVAGATAAAVGLRALAAAIVAAAVTLGLGRAAASRLGGLTGDVYGAIGEITFALTLVVWTTGAR